MNDFTVTFKDNRCFIHDSQDCNQPEKGVKYHYPFVGWIFEFFGWSFQLPYLEMSEHKVVYINKANYAEVYGSCTPEFIEECASKVKARKLGMLTFNEILKKAEKEFYEKEENKDLDLTAMLDFLKGELEIIKYKECLKKGIQPSQYGRSFQDYRAITSKKEHTFAHHIMLKLPGVKPKPLGTTIAK